MIFRGIVSALVVTAIASAAVITVPKYASTHAPLEYATSKLVESDLDLSITTVKPADTITTVKPADTITTVKPADKNATDKSADNIVTVTPVDNIATMKPADNITTVKPVPAQEPMISCYCNLPECLATAGGDGSCSTRLGCYSEVQPVIPSVEEEITSSSTLTVSNKTANASSVSPIISELVEATTEHAAAIRGSYGCLDQLHFVKQSCEEILKSMEAESSEFPIMQIPSYGAAPSAADSGVHAFHCCQTERCNGNQSGPTEGSVKSAQAVLVAALKNAFAPSLGVQNSTVGVPETPAVVKSSANNVELFNAKTSVNNVESSNTNTSVNNVESSNTNTSVNNVESSSTNTSVNNVQSSNTNTSVNNVQSSNTNTSVNNVESSNTNTSPNNEQISNTKKNNAAADVDLWFGYFSSPMGEPKAPSPLKSYTIFEDASIDATTSVIPVAMPTTLSVAVPVNQEITHDETIAKVEHVVTKRHDAQSAVPVLKQTIDDQENIADFDDDFAAEVAAAIAATTTTTTTTTTKLPLITIQPPTGSPQHSGVPDFGPPPSLKKKNITTNSILATRGVDNNINSDSSQADNNDGGSSMIGLICTIVVLGIIGLALLMILVLRTIIRKYDVFRNYKGVCSNPGQPCACNGGLTRRRPRTQPSSSHPGAAAAAVNRSASTAPLLPPPNPGHKYRGHANAGASYNDSIGDTTYVFTTIPVPDHVTPVRVVRR